MTRCVAYLRVSTDEQADKGVSLDAQRAKVQAYASLYDLELVAIEVDAGESAKSLERPALKRALAQLRKGGAEALLVVKLDRLTRSIRDLSDLLERYFIKKYALLSVGEQIDTRTAGGRMMLNMLTLVAQWEREAIGERTSAAMQHMRAEGRYTGGHVPYGWRLSPEGELLEHPEETRAIARARVLRAAGLSLRAVAATLEAEGLVSRAGAPFTPAAVAGMARETARA